MKTTLLGISALLLYGALFAAPAFAVADFWILLSAIVLLLNTAAAVLDPAFRASVRHDARSGLARKFACGLLSAAVLYAIFALGNAASRAILPFAASGIDAVYGLKQGASVTRIFLLMAFIIGPGEEILWRGFLQRALAARFGAFRGYLLASALYALVHVGSGNPMLVIAAAVCGLYWGWLYMKYGSITMNVVSHTAWDLAVFLLLPFSG